MLRARPTVLRDFVCPFESPCGYLATCSRLMLHNLANAIARMPQAALHDGILGWSPYLLRVSLASRFGKTTRLFPWIYALITQNRFPLAGICVVALFFVAAPEVLKCPPPFPPAAAL